MMDLFYCIYIIFTIPLMVIPSQHINSDFNSNQIYKSPVFHPPMKHPNFGSFAYAGQYPFTALPVSHPQDGEKQVPFHFVRYMPANKAEDAVSSYQHYQMKNLNQGIGGNQVSFVSVGTTPRPAVVQPTTERITWQDVGLQKNVYHKMNNDLYKQLDSNVFQHVDLDNYLQTISKNQLKSGVNNNVNLAYQIPTINEYNKNTPDAITSTKNQQQQPNQTKLLTELDMTHGSSNYNHDMAYDYYPDGDVKSDNFIDEQQNYYYDNYDKLIYTDDIHDIINNKIKKLMEFPMNSKFKIFFRAIIPHGTLPGKSTIRVVGDYRMENNFKLDDLLKGHKMTKRSTLVEERMAIYSILSDLIEQLGYDSHACVLRAVCEAGDSPLEEYGLIGEIMNMILAPGHLKEDGMDMAHTYAEEFGIKNGTCWSKYASCPLSLRELLYTGIVNVS